MTARVLLNTGPARSGKTARALAQYREALERRLPGSTLWLAPTWRAAASIRAQLVGQMRSGCVTPGVMTFDHLAEAVVKSSPEPVRPLGRLMKRQLVRLLVEEHLEAGRIRHFLPIATTGGLVDQICELIAELKRLDIWPDRFRDACRARGMTDKDAELLAVYEAYQQVLNEHHLYDAEGRVWSARQLLREGVRRPFERLRLVVVDGFADFTPPEHEILQILAGWVEEILITLPLEDEPRRADLFSKPARTLEELRRRHPQAGVETTPRSAKPDWPAMAHLEASLFLDPRHLRPADDTSGVTILAAARQLGEIELIGSEIKRLLTTGSEETGARPVRPGDVAVVFRSLGEAGALVREVFGRLGLPFALESGQTLDRSPALGALVGLVRLDIEDWPFRGLLALLSNNYFQPQWPEWREGLAAAAERVIRELQIPSGRASLLEHLRRETSRPSTAGETAGDQQTAAPDQRSRQARQTYALLARLADVFDRLPERASLGQWAAAWHNLAEQTGLLRAMDEGWPEPGEDAEADPPRRTSTAISDRMAWDTLQDALRTSDRLSALLGRKPPELDRARALAALVDTLQSVAVRDRGDESGRVRVLAAASARALQIPYLFVAGLAERSFPPAERQDRLYREAEARQLIEQGLPLVARTERNRDEMLLFFELITRATRHVWLSYPAVDEAAQPLSPSPYLEEVEAACGPGRIARKEALGPSPLPAHDEPLEPAELRVMAVAKALEGDASLLAGLVREEPCRGLAESLLEGLRITEAREDRQGFGPAEGMLTGAAARREVADRFGPAKTFRATELEQYASCPYRYFLERVLGLKPIEELELAVDFLARGQLVHRGLADFHERINQQCGGPTSPATLSEEDYRRLLDETTQQLAKEPVHTPLEAAMREVDLRLWARWADAYRQQHHDYDQEWQDCTAPLLPTWFEVSFGHAGRSSSPLSVARPWEIPDSEAGVRISGRIDRIDAGTVAGRTVFNVIDYKTGSPARFSREMIASGTALQLPVYALATEAILLADRQAVPWQAGYWYVRQSGYKPRQALRMHALRDGRLEPLPEWEQIRRTVIETVAALVAGIREAQFPVSSADDQCTGICPFRTVCRINQVRSLGKIWQRLPADN